MAPQKAPIAFSKERKKKKQMSLWKKDVMVLMTGQTLSCCHLISNTLLAAEEERIHCHIANSLALPISGESLVSRMHTVLKEQRCPKSCVPSQL